MAVLTNQQLQQQLTIIISSIDIKDNNHDWSQNLTDKLFAIIERQREELAAKDKELAASNFSRYTC